MKEYLDYLQQLSHEIDDIIHSHEKSLKTAKSKDEDKLQKLNQLLDNLKKLAPLLKSIDSSSLSQIHILITASIQIVNEKKIYDALQRLKLKTFIDSLIKYQFHAVNLKNLIVSLDEYTNDFQSFKKINVISQKNMDELQSIISLWAFDSSNLLFASNEEYIFQLKEVERHRNTLKFLIAKENDAIKTLSPKINNILLLLKKRDVISLIQQYINENSEILKPVKNEFLNINETLSPILQESDSINLSNIIEKRKDILNDAENRLCSFRNEILEIIDKLRSTKINWEIKNQSFLEDIEECIKKLTNLNDELYDAQYNIQLHIDRMLAIIGTYEINDKPSSTSALDQPIQPLTVSVKAYREKRHLMNIGIAQLNELINRHVNADDYRLTNILSRQQKSLNCPSFSLNYFTQNRIKMTDESHQSFIDQCNNQMIQTKNDLEEVYTTISTKLKLAKQLEYQILIKYKKSYSAINDAMFSEIKDSVISCDDFMSLGCHRLASMEKSPLIDEYINSIQRATNLEELRNALNSDPKNESGLSLRQNTGLSKVFGASLGGFIYGLFHHRYKSTCDEYASKLKCKADELIQENIEKFSQKNSNLTI